jgi:hypothetical protein
MANGEVERLVSENVSETVWLRLRRLTSAQLCAQLLHARPSSATADLIEKKSVGMSSAIRSALGYWDAKEGGLNSKILSRYYALLQITIAEQISFLDNSDDLSAVQRHTEYGHGLFTIADAGLRFPQGYYLGCLRSGHFAAYLRSLDQNMALYSHERRPRKFQDADRSKLVSLADLLRRVPELQEVIKEYIGLEALSFQIAHDQRNFLERSGRMQAHAAKTGEVLMDPPSDTDIVKSYVAIFHRGAALTAEDFDGFGFEIKNLALAPANPALHQHERFVGEVTHPKGTVWWNFVDTYKSGYSGTSLIVPLWGTRDPFVLHFAILYAFSIVVRYLPETWHSIEHGSLDNVRALLEHYLVIVDNVLPHLAVERLTQKRLLVVHPGSMNAPV